MRKKKLHSQGNEVIYILVSKNRYSFFIAKGNVETLHETYRHHLKKRRGGSINFINCLFPERPCFFVLEKIDPEEESDLLLIWLRILRENRFVSFNHPDLIEQSEHLYYNNIKAYEKRKDTDLSGIFSCKNCIVPTYKQETCARALSYTEDKGKGKATILISEKERKRTKEIRIRVTEQEYNTICHQASRAEMQIGPYVRTVAMNPVIRPYDYSVVSEHTNEIATIRNAINRLIFTIEAQNNYLPREIQSIVLLMQEIFATENILLKIIRERYEKDNRIRKVEKQEKTVN